MDSYANFLTCKSTDYNHALYYNYSTIYFVNILVVVREERGTEPDHLVGLKLGAVEFRLDYMGTAVLMSRISSLETILKDEWNQAKTSHTRR